MARRADIAAERFERIESGEESPTLEEIGALAAALEVPTLALLAYSELCNVDGGKELFELLVDRKPRDLRSARRLLSVVFDEYFPEEEKSRRKPPGGSTSEG